jgi:hypothetical protein
LLTKREEPRLEHWSPTRFFQREQRERVIAINALLTRETLGNRSDAEHRLDATIEQRRHLRTQSLKFMP